MNEQTSELEKERMKLTEVIFRNTCNRYRKPFATTRLEHRLQREKPVREE